MTFNGTTADAIVKRAIELVPEIFEMTDRAEIERSVAVMSLGLCAAIVGGSVSLTLNNVYTCPA